MINRMVVMVTMIVSLAPIADVEAAKLQVAVNGTDGPECGASVATACRTIRRAIMNAAPGDTIEVGPGRYGDVDGDGAFASPGDEAAEVDAGCDCLVRVPPAKPVVIVSRLGASATILDAGGAGIDVVQIDAAGATFGKLKKGFTLTGSADARGLDSGAFALTVGGNVAVANGSHGFRVQEDRAVVVGNQALSNGASGFFLDGANDALIRRNVAVGNGDDGFSQVNRALVVENVSIRNGNDGFDQQGDDVVYRTNTALGNGTAGFDLNEGDRTIVVGVLAQGNGTGIQVDGSGTVITKSSVVANRGPGILVEDEGQGLTVSKTNVFGNGPSVVDPALTNCGVASLSGGPLDVATVFWGAADGPGDDPADELCLLVPHMGLVAEPQATKELKVKPPR